MPSAHAATPCAIDLQIHDHGSAGAPPMLWLHGFLGAADDWDDARAALPGRRHLTLDLPGHLDAPLPAARHRLTIRTLADAIAGELRRRALGPVTVLGYSLGGRLALALAVHHPDCVGALILASTSPGIVDRAERLARLHADLALATRIETTPFATFLREWYDQPLFHSRRPTAADAAAHAGAASSLKTARARRLRHHPAAIATALRRLSVGRQAAYWRALPQLTQPVLLLAGEVDTKYVDLAQRMRARMPHATLDLLPDCGHAIHLDWPAGFAARLAAWLP